MLARARSSAQSVSFSSTSVPRKTGSIFWIRALMT
ncbi:hypothetical protein HNR50_003496 [Spirochaeta isovalerica]|uniref:Uncharacterized protein n=1 Tax=Spirochaeta isovalerica TaxID=150 RepID=A0A841RCT7_9SPIO|nr:hypothetical protein [Spirochaeta isovalerica]